MSTLARAGTNGADIAIPMAIQGNSATCAQIKIQDQFELGLGEWAFDLNQGMPYFNGGSQQIMGVKNPNIPAITSFLENVIINTPGIIRVVNIVVNYSASKRNLAYYFKAINNQNAVIEGGNTPFTPTGQS